jgi:recombination protein RecT
MANEVAKKTTLGNYLEFPNTQKFLTDQLKEKKTEFVSNLLALYDSDENLKNCDPVKLTLCAMNATALNLPLNKNLGYAYIIPYKNTKGEQIPSFQIGYKGLIQLALRSGQYEHLNACDVREGEITRNKITGEIKFLGEKPDAEIIGYIAYLKLKSGFQASLYMSEAQIEKHALKFSKMYAYDKANKKSSSKWSDPDIRPKMAKKTVLKGLLGTWGVLSAELVNAFDNDNEAEVETTGNRNISDAEVVTQSETNEPEKVKI